MRRVAGRSAANASGTTTRPAALAGSAGAATSERAPVTVASPEWATPTADQGPAAPESPMQLTVVLNLRDEAAATTLVGTVSDPSSTEFGHYLTAAEFRDRFAPTDAQLAAVSSWLTGAALTVGAVPANRRLIPVSGTVAAVEAAFATRLDSFASDGRTVRAPVEPVTVPAAVAD